MSKPAFDPNKPYREVKPAFDPSKPYEEKADDSSFIEKAKRYLGEGLTSLSQVPHPGLDMPSSEQADFNRAALKQAANTTTLEHLPEIYGAAKSLSVSSPEYLKNRDSMKKELDNAPGGAKLVGTIAGLTPHLLVNPASAATTGGRMLTAGAMGGLYGAATNPGSEEGKLNPLQAGERTGNALKGAALNFGLSGITEAGIKGLSLGVDGAKNVIAKMSNWLTGIKDPTAARRVLDRPAEVLGAYKDPNAAMDEVMELVKGKMDDLNEQVSGKQKTVEAAKAELQAFEQDLHTAIQEEQLASRSVLGEAKENYSAAATESRDIMREAKAGQRQAVTSMKEELKGTLPGAAAETEVTGSVGKLKELVNELSDESRDIAANSVVNKKDLMAVIHGSRQKLRVDGTLVTEGAKTADAKLGALAESIAGMRDQLAGNDVKTIIQQLDPSINWLDNTGQYMDQSSRAYVDVREGVDELLKLQSRMDYAKTNRLAGIRPGQERLSDYEEKMLEVAHYRKMLGQASEEFGNPKTITGKLQGLASDTKRNNVDLLEAVAETTDAGYMSEVDKFINARKTLSSPTQMDELSRALPQSKEVAAAEQIAAGLKQGPEATALRASAAKDQYFSDPIAKKVMQEDAVAASGLPGRLSSAEQELAEAQAVVDPYRRLTPEGTQSKLSTAATGANRENTKLIGRFGEEMVPELTPKVADIGAAKAFSGAIGPAGGNYGRRTALAGTSMLLGGAGAYHNRHDPTTAGAMAAVGAMGAASVSPAANIKALGFAGKLLGNGGLGGAVSKIATPMATGSEAALRNGATNALLQSYFAGQERKDLPPEEKAQVDRSRVLRKVQSTSYAAPLQRAAERGDDAYATTYHIMYQNHEDFRSIIDDEDELE